MGLRESLGIGRGVTSVVGSGGKTSLLRALSRELPGTLVLATTTRILPFPGVPLVTSPDEEEIAAALRESRVVCVGTPAERGKLAAPGIGIGRLARLADHVLVEADGARHLPLKAHAPWEPVVPPCSGRTVLVVGASGLSERVRDAVHRPERFCELAGCELDDIATPERVARAIDAEGLADTVLISQAGAPGARGPARRLAALLDPLPCHLWT